MPRDRKGKVNSKRPLAGTSSGYEQNFEDQSQDQVPFGYEEGAATPRSYQEPDLSENLYEPMDEGGYEFTASSAIYSEQGYDAPQEAQQDQWPEQQENWSASSSAQLPSSSHSGTNRSRSSRDTGSRHHGRHGQRQDRYHGGESGPADPSSDEAIAEMAERQLAGGTAGVNEAYTGGLNQDYQDDYSATYQGGSATENFGAIYADSSYGNPSNPSNPMLYGSHGAYGNPTRPYVASAGFGREHTSQKYRRYHSREFRVGRVLRVLWPEPLSQDQRGQTLRSVAKNDVFTKERRFLILQSTTGHSLCAPILTYGNQACNKNGVHPKHHGIIYSEPPPQMLDGEPELGIAPVRMIPYDVTESLRMESRVNYSKRYTVEHNVSVSFVGEIANEDLNTVIEAMTSVWARH